MLPVKVREIAYDVMMNPVVLLINEEEDRVLPIWIGHFEAHAISVAIQDIVLDRPLTHDLMKHICDRLKAKMSMVLINDVNDGTYFAELHLWHRDKELVLDSRPSDAIALGLRTGTPIYLSEKVTREMMALKDLLGEEQQQELKELLEANRPQDIKKSLH
jgi:hypothetical protein